MERYIGAWNSNDPDEIGALFTDDALYCTEPFAPPWRGRAEIIDRLLARKDESGQATFEWQPLIMTPEVAKSGWSADTKRTAKADDCVDGRRFR
jgi:hypothetical protein